MIVAPRSPAPCRRARQLTPPPAHGHRLAPGFVDSAERARASIDSVECLHTCCSTLPLHKISLPLHKIFLSGAELPSRSKVASKSLQLGRLKVLVLGGDERCSGWIRIQLHANPSEARREAAGGSIHARAAQLQGPRPPRSNEYNIGVQYWACHARERERKVALGITQRPSSPWFQLCQQCTVLWLPGPRIGVCDRHRQQLTRTAWRVRVVR